jgi:prophage regulatory protein
VERAGTKVLGLIAASQFFAWVRQSSPGPPAIRRPAVSRFERRQNDTCAMRAFYQFFHLRGARLQPEDGRLSPVSSNERIIRLKTVLDRTGLSRSTLYRKIAEGTFPRQVPISINGAGWHESAINRWIADPAAYREDRTEGVLQ